MNALEFKEVTKRYSGRKVLDRLSFQIPAGSTTALVGANGAGKTTSLSLVGGFIKPHHGSILTFGVPVQAYRNAGNLIGILPQDMQFFEFRSLRRQLYLFARLAGMPSRAAHEEVERVAQLVALSDKLDALAQNLSRGMKVRLGIAQALVGNPRLILLDEPTAGLDPEMVSLFRNLILSMKGKTTLVISSHNLSELEELCDYVCIIDRGVLVKQGSLQQLVRKASEVTYTLGGGFSEKNKFQMSREGVLRSEIRDSFLELTFDPRVISLGALNAAVYEFASVRGFTVEAIIPKQGLEDTYLQEISRSRTGNKEPLKTE